MTDSSFGSKLASERIRRGLTLEQVSATLRIRPAILESLETGDFHHMPLKGHARNMVSSYARYLGLDPAELTEQFLRDYHDFEEGMSRVSASSRRVNAIPSYHSTSEKRATSSRSGTERASTERPGTERPGTVRPGTARANATGSDTTRSSGARRQNVGTHGSQGVRSMWNRSSPASSQHPALEKRPDYDRDHTKARTASLAQRRADTRRTSGNASGNAGSRRTRGADNSYTPAGRGYGSAGGYSSAKAPLPARLLTALFKSPVTAIVALALVLILLLVLWALAANSCTKQTDEFIPASGAALTESEAIDPDTGLAIPDLSDDLLPDPRYGPFQLVVEPASETTPWTEITVDGENVFTGMLDVKMTWEVIDYCEVSTAQPGNLTVKRNDTAEEMDIDEDGIASIRLDVEERPANDRTTNAPAEGQQSSGTSDEG